MRDMARSAERKTIHSPNTPPGPPASISCRKDQCQNVRNANAQSMAIDRANAKAQTVFLRTLYIERIYLRTEKPTPHRLERINIELGGKSMGCQATWQLRARPEKAGRTG